ncbi:MAG: flagellar hook-associated protein FlgK [Pseudomonadota bacterium]
MSLFDIGVSGLRAQQAALTTTGQNITNASTPGYSRQRVALTAEGAGVLGNGFSEARVQVSGVERIADALVTAQVRSDESLLSEMTTLVTQIDQVDSALFRNSDGLGTAFSEFFNALDAANLNPDASTERRLVLERGERLVDQLATVQNQLDEQARVLNVSLSAASDRISALAQGIAEVNTQIDVARGSGNVGADNQLQDQRDELLRELSSLVGLKVVTNAEGQVNVFMGKGQPLVLGAQASSLTVDNRNELLLRNAGANSEPVAVTRSIVGGEVGGLLEFQNSVLRPTQQRLGQLGLGFTEAFNLRHQQGISLDGLSGRSFFNGLNEPDLVAARVVREDRQITAPASLRLEIDSVAEVPLSDYRFSIADELDGGYRLQRISDGQILLAGRVESLARPLEFDGMRLSVDPDDLAAGQSYRLTPFGAAADKLSVVVNSADALALAQGAVASASVANSSNAELRVSEIAEISTLPDGADPLPDDLLIRFVAPDRYEVLDNSDPARPLALEPALRSLPYTVGQSETLLATAPGSTRIASTTLQVGEPQPAINTTSATDSPPNGYEAQLLELVTEHANGSVATDPFALRANDSARVSADRLNALPGIQATAYTDLRVSAIEISPDRGAPQLLLNGIELGPVSAPEELVERVNGSSDLAALGISATLSEGQAIVSSAYGDDLSLALRGGPETAVEVVSDRGQRERLRGQGVGDPPVLIGSADVRGPITLSSGTDYNLFVSNGGDSGATITLSGSFGTAADLVFEMQRQVDAELGPNQIEIGLNPGGQIRIVGMDIGSDAALTVAPNGAMGSLLGISTATVNGNERYATTTVGGTIAAELDPGVTLRGVGGGPFAPLPETSAPVLPFSLSVQGAPQAGDEFTVSLGRSSPLGNGVGLELAALREVGIIGQRQDTISTALSETIEFVGIRGNQARADQSAADSLLQQSVARRESISGVNLDEEAANLIRFEQGYNASAQVIAVAREVFNTLINAIA